MESVISMHQADGVRGVRRTTRLRDSAGETLDIYHEFIGEVAVPEPYLLDASILSLIFRLMASGVDLHVEGRVSSQLIRNLREFQEAWSMYRPELYRLVRITADEVIDAQKVNEAAIAAFSGGVDSFFTALRHSGCEASCYSAKAALLVHGFDIAVDQTDQYNELTARITPFAQELGLSIIGMETNSKAVSGQSWEDSFSAQLAGCLHQFGDSYGNGLIGSSEPYDALYVPWGSSPTTDYLLSGGNFQVVHDGAGFSRTQKVARVVKNAAATRCVKVCWEGPDGSKNCGECEKCIRTRLNFAAVGVLNPECFDQPFDKNLINKIWPPSQVHYNEFISIADYMDEKGVTPDLSRLLRARLVKWSGRHRAHRRAASSLKSMTRGFVNTMMRT